MAGSAVPGAAIAEAVAGVRAYLRMEGDGEAALLARVAGAAILTGEAYCGTAFVRRGFEDVIGAGSGWQRLRAAPVAAIAGVTGLPAEGAPFVLPVAAYGVDIDGDGGGWVRIAAPGAAGRVAVSYTAGIAASWDDLPAALAQGVTALAAHLFQNRDADAAPPAAVAALWRPFRRLRLGEERRV